MEVPQIQNTFLSRETTPDSTNLESSDSPQTKKRGRKKQEQQSLISWKTLLPRPPNTVSQPKLRLPTPTSAPHSPRIYSTPGTPISPQEPSLALPQPDLMPMLLKAAAQAAVRDKRQERKIKNRAAAYESRKRKREASEQLMAENKQLKGRVHELEIQILNLTQERALILKENEKFKSELEEKKENGRLKSSEEESFIS